jgi:ribosomal protein S18 acetylase RimI-like enzyme
LAGWRKHLAGGEGVTLVAEDSGRVVGFCTAIKNRDASDRFPGEIGAIYLLEEAQRRGLGRELFAEATRWLKAQGLEGFLVWVLKENQRARRFYEALGGELLDERPIQIGDASYPEVSYGWEPDRSS